MITFMRFSAFLFRHPVLMIVYGIIMWSLQWYLFMWTVQYFAPSVWTQTFELWSGLIWLALCAVSFAYAFYVRGRFGCLLQELFGKAVK